MNTEGDVPQTRPPEPINITILRIKNLKGSKGDMVNAAVKVEFGDRFLGESPKQECTPDIPAEFNFTVNLLCTYDDPTFMDEITHKPVVVTIVEVLVKEKRQKEEKMNIIGQCCIDLLPLIKGATDFLQILPIVLLSETPSDVTHNDTHKPEIEIRLSVAEPLLDETRLNESNLLTVSVGSLYSPPDSWTIIGTQYTYGLALPVPISADKELPIVFTNGRLKNAQDKEGPQKQKRWAVPGTAIGNVALIPDKFMALGSIESEDGDFKAKEDIEHRNNSELEKNRVTWNMERRCYLRLSAVKKLQESIMKNHFWPVEVMRLSALGQVKGKKEEEPSISFHGVAFLNLCPLLYPGVTSIRGAFKVTSYSESVLFEKTSRKVGICEDVGKMSALQNKFNSPSLKKVSKEPEKKEIKKMNPIKSETILETDGLIQPTLDSQQYTDAKSYIMIEVKLDKPLIPKRTTDELLKSVAELIPPRAFFPKRTDRAQKVFVQSLPSAVSPPTHIIKTNTSHMSSVFFLSVATAFFKCRL